MRYREAIVIQLRYGFTNKEMAEKLGVTTQTYQNKRSGKEGKAFIKEVTKLLNDPKSLVDRVFQDEAVHTSSHLIDMRDALHNQGSFMEAAKIDMKILEAVGYFQKNAFDVNVKEQQIIININQSTEEFLQSPSDVMEADYELLGSATT